MAKTHLTAGQLRDLLERAWSVIVESEGADEHTDLVLAGRTRKPKADRRTA